MKWLKKHESGLKFLTALICVFCAAGQMSAQEQTKIEGVVLDGSGAPVIGAAVIEKDTDNGVITDVDGKFSINVRTDKLLVSSLGYQSTEYSITDRHTGITIIMQEDAQVLDEVQVIGYAVVKKSDLTGSVSSVKSDVMEDRMVVSIEDALRGQLAGVHIQSTDGAPGAAMNIRIRGASSINASNSPLYVIDGVPMESTDISPAEIESMEILKDASSTAIYGSRGANGVVIITTKKGKKGAPRINFSATVSVQQPVNLYEMMNAEEFARYLRWGYGRTNGSSIQLFDREGNLHDIAYANNYVTRYEDVMNGTFTTDTDWQRAMLRNALSQDYRLSVSGGDDKTSYSVMGSVMLQDGTIINSGMDRYNIRVNFDRQVLPWFKLGVNISGSSQNVKSVTGNVIKSMLQRPPTKSLDSDEVDITDENNTIDQNPVSQAYKVTNKSNRMTGIFRGYADITFAKIFRLNISGSYSYKQNKQERYYPSDVQTGGGNTAHGKAQTIIGENIDWLNENILYITPSAWGNHSFDAMVGATLQGWNDYTLNTEGNNFTYEDKGTDNMGMALTPVLTTNEYKESRLLSFLGRVNYKFKDRYLFTASIRADGSSRLADGNKWGYFPSGAFAWRISEEPFIKKLGIFSDLKLRLSAGVSGNTGITPYQTMALMDTSGYPMDGSSPSLGFSASRTRNPDLKWETTAQYDAGLDVGMWDNRLRMTVDVYLKKTSDLLLRESVPTYLGYETRWTNRGKVSNRGLEISISGYPVDTKNFTWTSSFNISFNRSRVDYISESGWMILESSAGGASNFGYIQEGKPLGLWYGYKSDGVYKSYQEIEESGLTSIFGSDTKTVVRPGYNKYVDVNNDHKIDESDRTVIGSVEPKFTGGFTNVFRYKDFELNIGLEFRYGGTVFNSTRMSLEGAKGSNVNQTKRAAKYAFYPSFWNSDTGELYFKGNEDIAFLRTPCMPSEPTDYTCRSLYIEDASYLRINDITLSYSLPAKIAKKAAMSNFKIFLSVKNAFVFSNYSGYDPDVNSTSSAGTDLLPGLDDCAYPRTRNYSVGINVTF